MKKGLIVVMLLICICAISEAVIKTESVVIDVSSDPVTGAASASWSCDISSANVACYIPRITITNSDTTVAQTVSFYDNCTTTDTLTKIWEIDLDASGTAEVAPVMETFSVNVPLKADYGLVIRKTLPDSDITVSVQYGNW